MRTRLLGDNLMGRIMRAQMFEDKALGSAIGLRNDVEFAFQLEIDAFFEKAGQNRTGLPCNRDTGFQKRH